SDREWRIGRVVDVAQAVRGDDRAVGMGRNVEAGIEGEESAERNEEPNEHAPSPILLGKSRSGGRIERPNDKRDDGKAVGEIKGQRRIVRMRQGEPQCAFDGLLNPE